MRRATLRALRSARRLTRKPSSLFNPRNSNLAAANHLFGVRSASTSRHQPPLQASSGMYIRRFSYALASGFVGYAAWYGYRGGPDRDFPADGSSLSMPLTRSYTTTSSVYRNPHQTSSPTDVTEAPTERVDRQVVVVSADNIYTGKIEGTEPISKLTGDSGQKVLEMLTPDQATSILRKNEESYFVNRGQGVVRYDVVQIPSNNPIEDDHSEKIVEVAESSGQDGSDWMFWGVYDGHSGWTTSAKLRQVLINYVARELNTTYKSASNTPDASPSNEAIQAAMKTGFNKLDYEIVHAGIPKVFSANSKLVAAELLAPALSGACALLSFYDTRSKLLHVACTGDSRAVLGRRSPTTNKWTAKPLSVDQTGSNPEEAARLRREHPGEERDVVRNGRILGGLEPSRAFGDATYKWTREVAMKLKDSFFGRTPSQLLRTPPYVTAEPIVTTTKIQPESGDFVVMATDGLWEMLTNEEVVGLVGQWIEKQTSSEDNTASSWLKMFQTQQKGLPVEHVAGKGDMKQDGQKTPIRQRQWGLEGGEDEKFITKDSNVATHLVRNALGGKNEEMVRALLTLPSPYSRRYRDDLTVEVIFFGVPPVEDAAKKDKSVVVNPAATAPRPVDDIKAKL